MQSTLPRLTTAMFSFSIAAIGFTAATHWPEAILGLGLTNKNVAFVLLGLGALAFHFATEGCVITNAWDHNALGSDRKKEIGLSDDPAYLKRCRETMERWFARTIWAYRLGFLCLMTGLALLFWAISKMTSVLVVAYCLFALCGWITSFLHRRAMEKLYRYIY